MKITIEEINDIIKDMLVEYDDLHPLTELVEYDNVAYLSIHRWKMELKKANSALLEERIKNLVEVYTELNLVKETEGNTSVTSFDVYKLAVNGH